MPIEDEKILKILDRTSKIDISDIITIYDADYETSMEAVKNGTISITHTFNAMKLSHQHYPVIAGAIVESDAYCEAIVCICIRSSFV